MSKYYFKGHVTSSNAKTVTWHVFTVKTESWRSRDCFKCENIISKVRWLRLM